MGFLDLFFQEDYFRPAPLNTRQEKFIRRTYKNNMDSPKFFEKVCSMSDKQCNIYPDRSYQTQLKKMVYNFIDGLRNEQSSIKS